jgi:hypothetical protein
LQQDICNAVKMKLALPVSPTPLPSSGAGVSRAIAYAVRYTTSAGPLDAVVDLLVVEDCKAAVNYIFFFLRFVFFAVFFAAVFVFVFRFFAMLPS